MGQTNKVPVLLAEVAALVRVLVREAGMDPLTAIRSLAGQAAALFVARGGMAFIREVKGVGYEADCLILRVLRYRVPLPLDEMLSLPEVLGLTEPEEVLETSAAEEDEEHVGNREHDQG